MRRIARTVALPLALVLAGGVAAGCSSDDHEGTLGLSASAPRRIDLTQWVSNAQLRSGTPSGVRIAGGRATFAKATGHHTIGGRAYDMATWTGPWRSPGFSFTQLVASWAARTPGGSWASIQVRGRTGSRTTSWDTLANWAVGDRSFRRTSPPAQTDDGTGVDTDTWKTGGLTSYQLRVHLLRPHGSAARPFLDAVGAMTSRLPAQAGPTSKPGPGNGKVLPVPTYSQMIHRGQFPKWGGGGEAWCSPTSTSMVLGYYRRLPAPSSYTWVPATYRDRWVDAVARSTYDHRYDGTGNWPFNTAYAATRTGRAFVTRLRSLREAGRFIAAGIPLVVSVAFGKGQLSGAPISASNGHLIVLVGFTKAGNPVVNDPAAATDKGVRRVYDRAQFERAWLNASGGMAYVIHDSAHPLPKGSASNW